MATWIFLLACLLVLFLVSGVHAQSPDSTARVTVSTPPAWLNLKTSDIDHRGNPTEPDEQSRYLLYDRQVNVGTGEQSTQVAIAILTKAGVQNESEFSVSFDPTYQTLHMHHVRVLRAGKPIDKLEREKIKIIQQERELDRHLYNGRLSAVLFLEDVRVGDVLEYAYTLKGFNPIFGRRYTDAFLAQWSLPVNDYGVRVLWPKERRLFIRNHGTQIKPIITEGSQQTEYRWEWRNLAPVVDEDSLPVWYDAYPWIQLSEFESWDEVIRWALPLYSASDLSPSMREKIEEWTNAHAGAEERLLAALKYVQDEVRYLGIELGSGSYQPTEPSAVYARRFGDCKDKTLLFCALLKGMGIEAFPALVHTENRHMLEQRHPSPTVFDHVITRVTLGQKVFWLDPTRSYQRGPLSSRYLPDYQRALVVHPETKGLSIVERQAKSLPFTTTTEKFVVKGKKDPAALTIVTVAEGRDAETMRRSFAEDTRENLQKEYLNFYAQEYPRIRIKRPLEVMDLPGQNTFRVTESYEIDEFWVLNEKEQVYECEFYPRLILDLLDKPSTRLRTHPFALNHPRKQVLRTEVTLPESWPVEAKYLKVKDPAFQFVSSRTYSETGFKLVMDYSYESSTDSVAPKEVPQYLRNVDKATDQLGYSLTWNVNDPGPIGSDSWKPNWLLFAIGGFYMVPLLIGTVFVYRLRPRRESVIEETASDGPKGLGGWLILPAIGLIFAPFRIAKGLYDLSLAYSMDVWHVVTVPGTDAYHPLWAPMIVFSLLGNLTLLVVGLLAAVLFFQKRRLFPWVYISYLLGTAVLLSLDYAGTVMIPVAAPLEEKEMLRDLFRSFFACLIWIPYMLKSKRVKATFVE